MGDVFFDGADRYPRRGWRQRAALLTARAARDKDKDRPCPTCAGAGVWFEPAAHDDELPRPRVCHDCGGLKVGPLGGR